MCSIRLIDRYSFIENERKNYRFCRFFFMCWKMCFYSLSIFFFLFSWKNHMTAMMMWKRMRRKKENCNFTLNTRLSSYVNVGCIFPYMFMFVCAKIVSFSFFSPFSCVWEIRHFKNSNSTAIICFLLLCVTFNCLTLWQGRKFLLFPFFYSFISRDLKSTATAYTASSEKETQKGTKWKHFSCQ